MRSCHAVPLLVTVCESADSTAPTRERARSAWILRSDAAGPLNFGRHRTSGVALGVSAGSERTGMEPVDASAFHAKGHSSPVPADCCPAVAPPGAPGARWWSIRQGRWTAAVTDALAPARSHPGRQRSTARLTSRHHRLDTTSQRRSITPVPDLRPRHPMSPAGRDLAGQNARNASGPAATLP